MTKSSSSLKYKKNQDINTLIITVTRKCNLNCSYCIVNQKREDISFDSAKKQIDNFIELNDKDKNIIYYGGEPLLEKNKLKKVICYVYKKKSEITQKIVTNGTIYDKRFFDFLRSKDVKIGVSLDLSKKKHNKNRKYQNDQGSFSNVIENIKKIKPDVILSVLSQNSIKGYADNLNLLLKKGYRIKIDFQKWCKWKRSSLNSLKTEINNIKKLIQHYRKQIIVSTISKCRENQMCLFTDNKLYDCTDLPYLIEKTKNKKISRKTKDNYNICLNYDKNFNKLKTADIKINQKVKDLFSELAEELRKQE